MNRSYVQKLYLNNVFLNSILGKNQFYILLIFKHGLYKWIFQQKNAK